MALIDKLNAIGDAIREKTGKTGKMTLDEMPTEIASIETGDGGDDYIARSIVDGSVVSYSNPDVTYIREHAFARCGNLTSVSFPNATEVRSNGFIGCEKLVSVFLPEVTKLGSSVFSSCKALVNIDLPKVLEMGSGVFQNAVSLETVIIRSPAVPTLSGSFGHGSGVKNGIGYIYVPSALVEEYKVATNWSSFASKFRAIEDYPDITGG